MNQTDQLLSDLRVDCEYSTLQVLSLRNTEQSLAANSCDFEVYSGYGWHDIISIHVSLIELRFLVWTAD